MEASHYLYFPATLPLGKEPLVPIEYETGWTSEPVSILWRREKSLATDSSVIQHVVYGVVVFSKTVYSLELICFLVMELLWTLFWCISSLVKLSLADE
jgi:hypothetical protein